MANMNALQQMIFPDENAPIHRKKSVTAASVKPKGTVLGQKKPRKALNDITNKSGIHPKASSKNKQIASSAAAKEKEEINIAGERYLHDHSKCIKEQQSLWDDDHFSDDLILLHHDSSIKEKHLNYDIEKEAKINLSYDEEPEEIPSPKLADWMKSSTPWRSSRGHGSVMMPCTPMAWRFDSSEFTLKEDCDDDLF